MVNKINVLKKAFKKCDYEKVFGVLEQNQFTYTLNNLIKILPKCDSKSLYLFLMYSISKKETTEKHITACECLLYIEPYVYEANNLIRWHIMRALESKSNLHQIMSWVIEVFGEDPSSPFTKEEISLFAKTVFENDKTNEIAKAILLSET